MRSKSRTLHRIAFLLAIVLAVGHIVPAHSQSFEIHHRFGSTQIDGTPRRVVSLSYNGHDFLLALGVTPVALRHWYGDHPFGVWPWAQAALGDAEPVVLRGAIDIERLAALKPDLIIGQWSGMTEAEYRLLSRIAPTLPPAEAEGDYTSSWRLILSRLGMALGRQAEAEAIAGRLDRRFAQIRAARPHWRDRTAVMVWPPRTGAYTRRDLRGRFLADLGFKTPPALEALAGERAFHVEVPQEDLSPIDADVLIWLHTQDARRIVDGMPLRPSMRAHKEGREIFLDATLTSALSHSSPLSLDYALDRLVPMIEAAVDGDPATPVPDSDDMRGIRQP